MKFNWDKILTSDEKIKKDFGISNYYLGVILVLTSIASVAVYSTNIYAGVSIFLLGVFYVFYLKKSKHYAFTDKRVILVDSFIGANIVSVAYEQITDIEIDQSPVDQILGWGTLIVNSAGTHSAFMSMPFVENPHALKQSFEGIRDHKK